jgi:hypothetical protein
MANLKYIDVPWHIKRDIDRGELPNAIILPDIYRCYKNYSSGKMVRVLPEGLLKDGCYIHANLGFLVKRSATVHIPFNWCVAGGYALIVHDTIYHLVSARLISADFKQYPTYPGSMVYDGLLRFGKYHPNHASRSMDGVFDYWSTTEGTGHRQAYREKLTLRQMIKNIRGASDAS